MTENRVVILGTGLAGLFTALKLSQSNVKSLVITKGNLSQTNTWRAQGGIASAFSKSDSPQNHLRDTLAAGDGLCSVENAKRIIEAAPKTIIEFISEGMEFDKTADEYSLGQEGGHHERRILHVSDQTGKAMHSLLVDKIKKEHSNTIMILENAMAYKVDSIQTGYNIMTTSPEEDEIHNIKARHLVLATGGAGKAFLYTSNWRGATGDGFKLAHDLGCELINAELVQFHPTCLFHPKAQRFLISEALRGEGAKLLNHKGERFMSSYPQAELSPRDQVSLAITKEIKNSDKDFVFLDIRHKSKDFLRKRFSSIFKFCLNLNIDISKDLIPVVPAAHYFCGGIATDSSLTQTNKEGLYAVGEAAYTGLHGANRLASNSLLECLVSAKLCAEKIKDSKLQNHFEWTSQKNSPKQYSSKDIEDVQSLWTTVRTLSWNKLGLHRSKDELIEAKQSLEKIEAKLLQMSKRLSKHPPFCELQSITFYAKAGVEGALLRKESRGCHYRLDFLDKNNDLYNTSFQKNQSSKVGLA